MRGYERVHRERIGEIIVPKFTARRQTKHSYNRVLTIKRIKIRDVTNLYEKDVNADMPVTTMMQ